MRSCRGSQSARNMEIGDDGVKEVNCLFYLAFPFLGIEMKRREAKSKYLRRNPIENRAILVFSGQNSGTRIISNGNKRKGISKFRGIVQTRVNFIISFISPRVSYENQHLFSIFGSARNAGFLLKRYLNLVYRSLPYDLKGLRHGILGYFDHRQNYL